MALLLLIKQNYLGGSKGGEQQQITQAMLQHLREEGDLTTEDQKSNPYLVQFPKLICLHPINELPLAALKLTTVTGKTLHA